MFYPKVGTFHIFISSDLSIEKLNETVEYDLEEDDFEFIEVFNSMAAELIPIPQDQDKKSKKKPKFQLTEDRLEILMDCFEKEAYFAVIGNLYLPLVPIANRQSILSIRI